MKQIALIAFLFLEILVQGQNYTVLNDRYWYYRTRLRNDFMRVGLNHGCSIPMEERGDGYDPQNQNSSHFNFTFSNNAADGEQAKWGDAMGELGYYSRYVGNGISFVNIK